MRSAQAWPPLDLAAAVWRDRLMAEAPWGFLQPIVRLSPRVRWQGQEKKKLGEERKEKKQAR